MSRNVLVIDDEIGIRELLSEILFDEGYRVHLAEDAEEAKNLRTKYAFDLILLDIWMPGMDGLALLKEWVATKQITMPIIMMSGHGTIEMAMEAIHMGAADFLEKPIALKKLLGTVAKVMCADSTHSAAPVVVGAGAISAQVSTTLPLSLDLPLREAREIFDSLYFNYQIQKENGNISRVAERAGIERTHLYRKLKQLGIKPPKKGFGGE